MQIMIDFPSSHTHARAHTPYTFISSCIYIQFSYVSTSKQNCEQNTTPCFSCTVHVLRSFTVSAGACGMESVLTAIDYCKHQHQLVCERIERTHLRQYPHRSIIVVMPAVYLWWYIAILISLMNRYRYILAIWCGVELKKNQVIFSHCAWIYRLTLMDALRTTATVTTNVRYPIYRRVICV